MFSSLVTKVKAAAESFTHSHANDAPAQSPHRDSLPLPASRDSPAASESIPTVVDLSSPTKPPRAAKHEEKKPRASLSRSLKRTISEDEKRLTGDYDNPADAVCLPDPSWWFSESQKMLPKPGANKGYKPVDTLNTVTRTTNRKPTTYGKHARPRPLIGQSPGPGQTAYAEFQRSKAPTTPGRHRFAQDGEDLWNIRPGSVKRRKLEHVIDLVHDEDDPVLVGAQTGTSTPGTVSYERPLSARSSQSRLSVGSGSTGADFRPRQTTNEFREVEGLIRPHQKKPRQPSCQKIQSTRQTSPFGSGSMSMDPHKFILRDFQQGEPSHRPKEHGRHAGTGQSITSKHFPKARINDSTTEQSPTSQTATRDASNSPNLRDRHRPVPKQVDRIEDTDSADELAMSPTSTRKKPWSPKAKKATQSSTERNGHGKDGSDSWPLSFARSYEWDGTGSTMEDGHATLILRSDPEGLRVQKYDTEGYHRVMLIRSQQVNKMFADRTGRIRLDGPRDADGNAHIFDLHFSNSSDFFTFCNKYAASLTTRGKVIEREDEHMQKLFDAPLRPRNDKAKSLEISSSDVQNSKQQGTRHEQAERQLGARARRSEKGIDSTSAPITRPMATVSTRSSRPRLSAPTQILDDDSEICEVPRYSIDTGLGPRWAKALEYGEGRQRAVVHFDDLPRLDEEEYLNDSLIDFYMIYLFRKLQVPPHKVYFFNTYFFTRLTENAGRNSMNYKAVERWTSKVDIFSYDYIVVPINDSQTHWYLAIICNVSNIQRKPVIEDFDQPHSHAREQSEACATPTVASESEEHAKLPLVSEPRSPERAEQGQNQQEDTNLFEEPTLSLIDREDAGSEARSNVKTDKSNTASLEPETEPVEVTQATADAKTTSQGRLSQPSSFIKSKNKRKTVPRRDPTQPVVVVLDSLGGLARSGAVRILKDWIAAEGKSKRGMEAVIKENGYYPKSTQIPMQKNWTDCGVYLLGYVEKFFQNPDEFMHKLLTGSMSAVEDWPELNPSVMRHKMREIIFECHKQQEEARKAQKKAKKGSAKPKTSPEPAAKQSADVNSPVENVSVEKSPKPETEKQHGQDVAADVAEAKSGILPPRPRLGSPFEPRKRGTVSAKQSPRGPTVKEADLPVPSSLSAKAAPATRSSTPPRHRSPEVRISRAHESISDAHTSANRPPGQTESIDQRGLRSPSINKRRRQDDNRGPEGSPNAKRLQKDSSWEKKGDDDSRTSPHCRDGSAPNAPIEIEDSQEVEAVNPQRVHVQSSHVTRRKPSPHLPRSTGALDSSSSIEKVPNLPSKAEIGKRRAYGAEVDDYDRDHNRRSPAPDPSVCGQTSQDTEEDTQDPVEVISQSTDQMQLDGTEKGDTVRETPEAGRRSPMPA